MSDGDPPDPPVHAEDPARRRTLARLTLGLSALVGALLAAGPVGLVLDPILRTVRRRPGSGWRPVGPVERFAVGGPPTRVVIREDRVDGWLSRPNTPVGPVLVQRSADDLFRVLSGVCPHLGCSVGMGEGGLAFLCPCHRSRFAADGSRVEPTDGTTNPAPRALDDLEWRVESGQLLVKWVRYRPGTELQVPIA
jgi:menaquinol-cytochrome c reductase iron-sulfur subunit